MNEQSARPVPEPIPESASDSVSPDVVIGYLRKINARFADQRNKALDSLAQAETQIEVMTEQIQSLQQMVIDNRQKIADLEHENKALQTMPASGPVVPPFIQPPAPSR